MRNKFLQFTKIPIHTQILLGMLLGVIVGLLFPVDRESVIIVTPSEEIVVRDWKRIIFLSDRDSILFQTTTQQAALEYFRKIPYRMREKVRIRFDIGDARYREYDRIRAMRAPSSFAVRLKPLGILFLNLLKMIAIPLVLGTLIVGSASIGNIRRMARIGGKTIGYYLVTTMIAITIGLFCGNIIRPGEKISPEVAEQLSEVYQEQISQKIVQESGVDLLEFLVSIVPTNPFDAIASGDMLHIVFFAVFFGLVLTAIPKEKAQPMVALFDALSAVMIKMVEIIMIIAPVGVLALIAAVVADFGFHILSTLLWYILTVIAGLALHALFVYPMLLKFLGRIRIRDFFARIEEAQLLAFSTSSSAATLPVSMKSAEKLGIPSSIYSFVLPLGATINMDGTALYQGVAALFIAQVYGVPLDISAQLTIVFIATMASIGTAPVPGVGIVMLIIVLQSVGIPEEGIALILGVDRILDMLRTTVNVTGDLTASVVIANSEKVLSVPQVIHESE